MARKEPKVAYVVFKGRCPGIYSTWSETEAQVSRYHGAQHRGYTSTNGGRAKAEEDFKKHIQQTAVMGNTIARVAAGESPHDSVTPGLPSAGPRAHKEPRDIQQQPSRGSPASNDLTNGQRKGPTISAVSRYSTSAFDSPGLRQSKGASPSEPVTSALAPSFHEPQVSYPRLPTTISRKRKARPDSCDIHHVLSNKQVQPLGSNHQWPEETISSKCGSLSSKNPQYPQLFVGDSDAPSSEDSSSNDGISSIGANYQCTDDETSSGDSGSDEDPCGDRVSKESLRACRGLTTSSKMQQCSNPLTSTSHGQDHRPQSRVKTALNYHNGDNSTTEYVYVKGPTYPSLPGQQQISGLEAALEYIPLCSSDDEESTFKNSTLVKPPPALPTEPELCEEQTNLVNLITSGKNVFYTGSAGCGKSTVLKAFVKRLTESGKRVKIIAPTGRAAVEVGGTTFWSFAGWHPDSMKEPMSKLANAARNFKWVNNRLCETDVLVIDEISMIENHHFERLNWAMKAARNNMYKFGELQAQRNSQAPFGGLQLVVTGDFCQLPPVKPFKYCLHCGQELFASEEGEVYLCRKKNHGPFFDRDKWTFRSAAWEECKFEHVSLTNIHRQSDRVFINILQKMRFGRPLSIDEKDLLLNHESETSNAVKLFPLVRQVKEVNDKEFARLTGPTTSFDCLDSYYWNREQANLSKNWTRNSDGSLRCLENHQFERRVELKRGMLVVLLVNLDINLGLINGSQGVILSFLHHEPARLPEQFGQHADLKKTQIEHFIDRANSKMWPLVKFQNGTKTFTRLIKPYCTVNELGESDPKSWVSRTQVPLLAAWAMSIHKSQGMTLLRVEVNVNKSFEKGQSYVALSRATSLHGLKVQALDDCDQGGNLQVMEFLREKFGEV